MGRHVAAEAGHLTRAAGDDNAVDNDRARGVADIEVAAAIGLPSYLPGPRIKGDDEIVPSCQVDAIAVKRHAAFALPMHGMES